MTSLGYCNVMNFYGSYSFILIIWLYGILSRQSPDIITSHNPLSDVTTPRGLFTFLFSFFLLPFQRPSVISPVSMSNWQAEDAAPRVVSLEGKLPQHLKPFPTGPVSGDDHIRGTDHVTVAGRREASTLWQSVKSAATHTHQLNHHGASLVLEIQFFLIWIFCIYFLKFLPPVNTSSAASLWNWSKSPWR